MNVEYFISKRIVSAKENKNVFSRPIIRLTIFAIALSVAIMLISLSILDGFQSEITNKVISFGSHIQIFNKEKISDTEEIPLELTDSLLISVQQNSEIKDISNIIYDFGLVKTDDDFMGINLKGVEEDYDFSAFSDKIIDGDRIKSDSSIFISENIANKLKLKVTDKIRVYFPSVNSERANVRPFYVCGIFNINMNELDEFLAFVSLSKLQKLKKWEENEVSLIEIKVSDFTKVDEVKESLRSSLDSITFVSLSELHRLKKMQEDTISFIEIKLLDFSNVDDLAVVPNSLELSLDSFKLSLDSINILIKKNPSKTIVSIKDLYPQIFDWLDLMNVNVVVIIVLMLIVAVVNIITSLLILILEKTKFIGILKSLGTSNLSIRKVFMYNSIYLVFKGLLWGNIIALLILFIQHYFQIISLDPELYYMNSVPISFDLLSFLMLNIGTLIVCFVMMILPTIVITKISAVKAIRFE
ncbi:MAG: ABC transporter permease [Flavobacteriales bacterium]|nr:ABC transporter permease [Flavobacteriales bacterium]